MVVTAGGRPIGAIPGPIPDNARLASYLPFEWILPKEVPPKVTTEKLKLLETISNYFRCADDCTKRSTVEQLTQFVAFFDRQL